LIFTKHSLDPPTEALEKAAERFGTPPERRNRSAAQNDQGARRELPGGKVVIQADADARPLKGMGELLYRQFLQYFRNSMYLSVYILQMAFHPIALGGHYVL
jgi:hypothetical protein